MKTRLRFGWVVGASLALAVGLGGSDAASLATTGTPTPGDRLAALDSFLGEWEGRMKDADDASPIFRARYTRILDGAAILYELKTEPASGTAADNPLLKYAHHAIISWDAGVNSPRARGVNSNGDAWNAVWTLSEVGNATGERRVWTIESTTLDTEGHTSALTVLKTFEGPDRFVETLRSRPEPNNTDPSPDISIEFVRVKSVAK